MPDTNNYPLVSIVLATYNGERYLKEQLDTVFQQTYPDLEIVAVDDCSSDSTVSILQYYASMHSNMRVYVNEKNIRHIKTFEKGISLSTGAFIALCDQDDIWNKHKIELLMKEINGYGMAFCDSVFIDEGGKTLNRKLSDIKNLATYNNCIPFIIGNCISGHAAVFTREIALSAIPFPRDIIHDWWLAFVASSKGTVHFVNQPLVQYRQHADNFIGAIKVKGRSKKETRHEAIANIRSRIKSFYEKCPDPNNIEAKKILEKLNKSYRSFSIGNNFLRMMTFYKYQSGLLALKKRTAFRKWLFCLKMFFKIV
jgi:glycosyltransferase involved in cell wall biosynthesis